MKILQKISPPYYADNMTFSPCGQYIACCNSVYDIEIWIYDRKGKLLATIIPPEQSTNPDGYPVLIWQDGYLILNAGIRVFVWRMVKSPNHFEFLYKFEFPIKVYAQSVQYLNHKLYIAFDIWHLKYQEMDLYNFQVYDLLTGSISEQTLYRNAKLIHDGVDLNIKLKAMLISKFNERLFVQSEFIGGEKPYQWHTFLTIDDKKIPLRNSIISRARICENANTGDFMVIAYEFNPTNYFCFYYNRSCNELINKTQSDIIYNAISEYQDTFLLSVFDCNEKKTLIWNVTTDKKHSSRKQIGDCISTYGDDVLFTIGEKMAIVNLSN